MRVDQRRPAPLAAMGRGARQRRVAPDRVAAVDLLEVEVRVARDEPRDVRARRLHLDRDRDRVAVVLDQVQDRKAEVARRVERFPELALAGRALAERDVGDLVRVELRGAVGDLGDQRVAQRRFRAAHGLEALGAGRRGLADDVERPVPPVGRHLAPARVRILGGADRGEEHLVGGHPEPQAEGPVPVVGVEPVVGGPEHLRRRGEHGLVPDAVDLEVGLVLPLEHDLPLVHLAGEIHDPVEVEVLGRREDLRPDGGRPPGHSPPRAGPGGPLRGQARIAPRSPGVLCRRLSPSGQAHSPQSIQGLFRPGGARGAPPGTARRSLSWPRPGPPRDAPDRVRAPFPLAENRP